MSLIDLAVEGLRIESGSLASEFVLLKALYAASHKSCGIILLWRKETMYKKL